MGHQLRLPTPNAGGMGTGSVLGQGTKIPQAKIVTKYIHPPVLKHLMILTAPGINFKLIIRL